MRLRQYLKCFVAGLLSLLPFGAVADTTTYTVQVDPYVVVVENELKDVSRTIGIDKDRTQRTVVVHSQGFKVKSNSGFVVQLRMPMENVRGSCIPVFRHEDGSYVKAEFKVSADEEYYSSISPTLSYQTRGKVGVTCLSGFGEVFITRPEATSSPTQFSIWLAFPAGDHKAGEYVFQIDLFPRTLD